MGEQQPEELYKFHIKAMEETINFSKLDMT
jgi:hypothetical protein